MHSWLLTRKLKITQVWPVPMCKLLGLSHWGCGQHSASFLALLIGNQGLIEKLEQSKAERRKIKTATPFGVAQRHLLSRMLLHVLDYLFPGSCKFFLDFSVAKLLRYNWLFNRIETENTNSAKYNLSLSANGMVYHIGVCAMVHIIPGLSHWKSKFHWKVWRKWGRNPKNWNWHFTWGCSATPSF